MGPQMLRVVSMLSVGAMSLSCVHSKKPEEPLRMISQSEAVELAKKELAQAGCRVDDYSMVSVRADDAKRRWVVYFEAKGPPRPGGHCLVWVNKEGGQAKFMPGE